MFQPRAGDQPLPHAPACAGSGEVRAAAELPPAEVPMLASLTVLQPAGGELHHEGPLRLGRRQVPGPRLAVPCVQQAGVRGPGECAPCGCGCDPSPRGWDATRVVEGEGTREPFPRMVCASALPGHSVPGVPHGH